MPHKARAGEPRIAAIARSVTEEKLDESLTRASPYGEPVRLESDAGLDANAKLPTTLYAIGDIHGMRVELDRLLEAVDADADARAGDKTVVFLGDFVNRGPSSREVLQRLIEGPRTAEQRWIFLRGNHDQLFLEALLSKGEPAFSAFMRKGGAATLASYGLRKKDASPARARRAVPAEHVRFLENTRFFHVAGRYFFVHAGVDPDRPLFEQTEKSMLTIRGPFLRKAHKLPCTVVHGHVPNLGGPIVAPGRIGVDTGAFASGNLTAVALCGDLPPRFLSSRAQKA